MVEAIMMILAVILIGKVSELIFRSFWMLLKIIVMCALFYFIGNFLIKTKIAYILIAILVIGVIVSFIWGIHKG